MVKITFKKMIFSEGFEIKCLVSSLSSEVGVSFGESSMCSHLECRMKIAYHYFA